MRTVYIITLLFFVIASAAQKMTPQHKETILNMHNQYREEVGSSSLIWDEPLAKKAYEWASYLAENELFEHSSIEERNYAGENLWQGTKDFYPVSIMIEDWAGEKKYYRYEKMKPFKRSKKKITGHYTQMVWKKTTKIGCAIANNGIDETLVCRYHPMGNIIGEYPY